MKRNKSPSHVAQKKKAPTNIGPCVYSQCPFPNRYIEKLGLVVKKKVFFYFKKRPRMYPAFISMTSEGPIMMQNQFSNARMIPQTCAKKEARTEIYNEILKKVKILTISSECV